MSWHPRQLGPQTGRTIVVTGASSGIGLEVARNLTERGAHVVMAVRDTATGAKAATDPVGRVSTVMVVAGGAHAARQELVAVQPVPGYSASSAARTSPRS